MSCYVTPTTHAHYAFTWAMTFVNYISSMESWWLSLISGDNNALTIKGRMILSDAGPLANSLTECPSNFFSLLDVYDYN